MLQIRHFPNEADWVFETKQRQTQTPLLKVKKDGGVGGRRGGGGASTPTTQECEIASGDRGSVYCWFTTQFLTRARCDVRSRRQFKARRQLDSHWLVFFKPEEKMRRSVRW